MSKGEMLVGLIDCNNFFVSCERLFRPDLMHKPVAVLSSNDGCIIARSKEVKELGIPMGAPYFMVKKELTQHGVTLFSSNFALYRDISKRVMDTIESRIDALEVYSVDEAFFITNEREAEQLSYTLKDRVEQWTGIPVSIGIAPTKTLAKLAGECAKKEDGIHIATVHDVTSGIFNDIRVRELWGVGAQSARKLEKIECDTVGSVVSAPVGVLLKVLGVHGERLHEELRGNAVYGVGEDDEYRKGISSSRSFADKTNDLRILEDAMAYHITHTAEKMRETGRAALNMSVSLRAGRHGNYSHEGGTLAKTFVIPIADTRMLIREGLMLLHSLYRRGVPYAKVGVSLWDFVSYEHVQDSLFGEREKMLNTGLMDTVDTLNRRFGADTVRSAALSSVHAWSAKTDLLSPQYTTRWDGICSVQAG